MKPKKLIIDAIEAQKNSQSKYSNFPVGSALLSDDGKVILGCNVESAVYPNTLCAERVAIYSAISQGYTKFKAIAIVSKTGAKPCGSCRQTIYEYLGNVPIYVSDPTGSKISTYYIKDLLPYPFDL
ncbi:MAG: cytidine deaminase [Candidatus Marinimicrobia bacterium]|nr:cytidine deaminase [Candidatus Neomarinimicrobiota bacterium]|tara:strand:- start:10892 stop:11269 length:378 start_codon:yes stop_codon:yes gene_type:complete